MPPDQAETPAPPPPLAERLRLPVEDWGEQKGTPDWAFAAARAMHRWARGRELTETEYDAAVTAATTIPIGY